MFCSIVYAAIRTAGHREFIDYETISNSPQEAQQWAERTNGKLPEFAEHYPVTRIARFQLRELAE